MSKTGTAADLENWVRELAQFVIRCDAMYAAQTDAASERRASTICFAGILERLDRISTLKGIGSLPVCRDALDFFDDIERGRDHPWRSLGPFGGAQQLTRSEQRLHAGAMIAVEMLVDAAGNARGAKTRAYEFVSKELADSGRTLSVSTLRGLHRKYRRGELSCEREVQIFLTTFWNPKPEAVERGILCEHGEPIHSCSTSGGGSCANIARTTEFYIRGIFADEMFLQTA